MEWNACFWNLIRNAFDLMLLKPAGLLFFFYVKLANEKELIDKGVYIRLFSSWKLILV